MIYAIIFSICFCFIALQMRTTDFLDRNPVYIGIPTLLLALFALMFADSHYKAAILLLCPLADYFLIKKPLIGVLLYTLCYVTLVSIFSIPILLTASLNHILVCSIISLITITSLLFIITPKLPEVYKKLFCLYSCITLLPLLFLSLNMFYSISFIAFTSLVVSDILIAFMLIVKKNRSLFDYTSLFTYWFGVALIALTI